MKIPLTRRDRFLFQYPPFEAMRAGEAPDFSQPAPTGKDGKKEGFQVYLHIPFCAVRCTFCYYGMMPNTYRRFAEPYLEDLHREIDMLADVPYLQDREVETLYFGGGTPTYLKEPKFEALVEHLRSRFRFAEDMEFTCEGEPTTIQESKLQLLKDLGVNRMSFGVQSFHPEIARINGRIAKPQIVDRALEWAKKTGFRVMNIDLMSGMLSETMETWKYSIDRLLGYEPEHMTIYRMEIKPGTQFFTQLQFNPELRKQFVGDEPELEMIDYAEERFGELGYTHHTHFSWISKREYEHTHRTNCWRGKDLIAIGESSFGLANGHLYQNVNPYRPYAQVIADGRLPVACAHKLSRHEQMTAYMVMGLKLLSIGRAAFQDRFGVDPLEVFPREVGYLEEQGAVEVGDDDIKVTRHGCTYADSFARVFYPPEYRQMDEVAVGTPAFDKMPAEATNVSELVALEVSAKQGSWETSAQSYGNPGDEGNGAGGHSE